MPPKHRQLHAPCPKASGNVLQALVNPPHDGNNLSFDEGDERTDGSDDNTLVITNPCDSEPPVPIQQWMNPAIVENIHILEKQIQFYVTRMESILDTASNHNPRHFDELNSKMDSLL
jgi:hypothetical protein